VMCFFLSIFREHELDYELQDEEDFHGHE